MDFFLNLNIIPLFLITFFAGFVKGAVGFAMPLIMFSGFLVFLEPEMAIALIILPSLTSNIIQATGLSILDYWRFLGDYFVLSLAIFFTVICVCQFYHYFSKDIIFMLLFFLILIFLLSQFLSNKLSFLTFNKLAQVIFGLTSGFFGGISGQWGPPLIIFFLTQNLRVKQVIGYQGIIYSVASIALFIGHLKSGIFVPNMFLLSIPFILISIMGQFFGFIITKNKNNEVFRKLVLWVLFFCGIFFIFEVFYFI